MTNKSSDCFGYALINNTLRLWNYNTRTHTSNNFTNWSSQELEYLSREKEGIKKFLEQEQDASLAVDN